MNEYRDDVRAFLMSRRARITPQRAGLPGSMGRRRVPGLRREEVATLAGVSSEYYARMERGSLEGASDAVLNSVAEALQLDDGERMYLFDLARRKNARLVPSAASAAGVAGDFGARIGAGSDAGTALRPVIQQIVDAYVDVPVMVRNGRQDLLAANALAKVLYAPMLESAERMGPVGRPPNSARMAFLDASSKHFLLNWEQDAQNAAAALRQEVGRNPDSPELQELIEELLEGSAVFRQKWATHDVLTQDSGVKRLRHPVVGEVRFNYESFNVAADPGLVLVIYMAEPGSPDADALALLANWSASTLT